MSWSEPFVVQWNEPTNGPWVIGLEDDGAVQVMRRDGTFAPPYEYTGSLFRVFDSREGAQAALDAMTVVEPQP